MKKAEQSTVVYNLNKNYQLTFRKFSSKIFLELDECDGFDYLAHAKTVCLDCSDIPLMFDAKDKKGKFCTKCYNWISNEDLEKLHANTRKLTALISQSNIN